MESYPILSYFYFVIELYSIYYGIVSSYIFFGITSKILEEALFLFSFSFFFVYYLFNILTIYLCSWMFGSFISDFLLVETSKLVCKRFFIGFNLFWLVIFLSALDIDCSYLLCYKLDTQLLFFYSDWNALLLIVTI